VHSDINEFPNFTVVYSFSFVMAKPNFRLHLLLCVSTLPNGVYFLQLKNEDGISVQRVVIAR